MKRDIFINELSSFCYRYILYDKSIDVDTFKRHLEHQLEDIDFVETLIREIIVKTQNRRDIDIETVKRIRLELETIKLNLEYQEYSAV